MDEIIWRCLRDGLSSIFIEPNRHLNMPFCVGAEGDVHIFPMTTHSPPEVLTPRPYPPFLFSLPCLVLWDFWLRLELLTEESHELELVQEKQTAQLEAQPLSKASNNMKPHPASLDHMEINLRMKPWEDAHTFRKGFGLPLICSPPALLSLSPWTMNGAQYNTLLT